MFGKFDIEKTLIMAVVFGLISSGLLYLDSKNNNYNVNRLTYLKLVCLVFFVSYVSSNLTNGGVNNSDLNIYTGNPDF